MTPPPSRRSLLPGIAIAIGSLVLALAIVLVLVVTRPAPEQRSGGPGLPRVVVVPIDRIPVQARFGGFGVAAAFARADVPSRISSTVIEVPEAIIAGAPVKAGQLLVRLDDDDHRRQLAAAAQQMASIDAQLAALETEAVSLAGQFELAEKDVQLMRLDLERVRAASAEGAAREREVDRAQQALFVVERLLITLRERLDALPSRRDSLAAQRHGFEISMRQAAADIERCSITSPVAGVLQRFDLKLGEMVRAGEMVARVVDSSRIEVPVQLPAGVRPLVHVGDPVELRSTDRRERTWSATIARIAPEDDQRNRTFTAWAELTQDPTRPDAIAPGVFLEVLVLSAQPEPLTVVPRRAIRGDVVFVVEDGVVRHMEIDEAFMVPGPYPGAPVPDSEWVALRRGPAPGSVIVLDASRVLPDGGRVEPVAPEAHRARGNAVARDDASDANDAGKDGAGERSP